MKTIDPSTGELLREYQKTPWEEVVQRVTRAAEMQREWARRSFEQRAECFAALASALEDRRDEFALLMAEEMGKPLAEGRAEIDKCALVCRYYMEHAAAFLEERVIETDAEKSLVTYRPMGLVLAVMPWNFPFWQVLRFAAPTLMAGNGAILKHSPSVLGCALAIEELFLTSGFPRGLFCNVFITVPEVKDLLALPEIKAGTLTGSTWAGRSFAAEAGSLLKKTVLELGGSDAYVVLGDADLDRAVEACLTSRLINAGQSCIAAKRLIVVDELYEPFVKGLVLRMLTVKSGDPRIEGTALGPLARGDLREALHEQVTRSVEAGAELLLGGKLPETPGYHYPPTVLGQVLPEMPAYEEELFGPVAAVIRARDKDHALAIAKDTSFGLGAAVFTADKKEGERIAREELEAGSAFVNTFVRSDPRLPFGGTKASGYGRELSSEGIREFVNTKTVYIA